MNRTAFINFLTELKIKYRLLSAAIPGLVSGSDGISIGDGAGRIVVKNFGRRDGQVVVKRRYFDEELWSVDRLLIYIMG